MVELLPVEDLEDLDYLESTLKEFHEKTGSILAKSLLTDWPEMASQFYKVGLT